MIYKARTFGRKEEVGKKGQEGSMKKANALQLGTMWETRDEVGRKRAKGESGWNQHHQSFEKYPCMRHRQHQMEGERKERMTEG